MNDRFTLKMRTVAMSALSLSLSLSVTFSQSLDCIFNRIQKIGVLNAMQCNALSLNSMRIHHNQNIISIFFIFRWLNVTQSPSFAMFNWRSEFSAIATSSIKVQYSILNIATSDIGHTTTKLIAFYAKQNEK